MKFHNKPQTDRTSTNNCHNRNFDICAENILSVQLSLQFATFIWFLQSQTGAILSVTCLPYQQVEWVVTTMVSSGEQTPCTGGLFLLNLGYNNGYGNQNKNISLWNQVCMYQLMEVHNMVVNRAYMFVSKPIKVTNWENIMNFYDELRGVFNIGCHLCPENL